MAERSEPRWLFLHGLGCGPFTMAPLLAAVPAGHPAELLDLYGATAERWRPGAPIPAERTQIAAIAARLWRQGDACDDRRVVLVAHSWGCRIALSMLQARPEAIAGMVLIDGSRQVPDTLLGQPEQACRALLTRLAEEPRDPLRQRQFLERFVAQCFVPGLTPAAVSDTVGSSMRQLPAAWMVASLAGVARWEASQLLPSLATLSGARVPLLAIQATGLDAEQRRVPLQQLEQSDWIRLLQSQCPHGQCWLAPPSGHLVQMEQSGPVVERIILWWRQQAGGSGQPRPRP